MYNFLKNVHVQIATQI